MFEIVNLVARIVFIAYIAGLILLAIKLESDTHAIRHKLSLWKLHRSVKKEMKKDDSLWKKFKAHSINDIYWALSINKGHVDNYIRAQLSRFNIGLEDVNISYEESPSYTMVHITHK